MTFPRQFESSLANDFTAYLELKRTLGIKLVNAGRVLRHLDRFLARRFPDALDLSVPILEAWMAESRVLKPQSRSVRLSVVRQFCLYRRRKTPEAFAPDRARDFLLWPVRVPRRVPFIYSTNQVKALLRAALDLPATSRNPHRPQTMFILLLLLYTTGLRVSEAVHLRVQDVDLTGGVLCIRETKFFKTRLVPLAGDVLKQLRRYLALLMLPQTEASCERPLFMSGRDRPYVISSISTVGCQLLRTAGLKPLEGRRGPRLHDLRHSFAVHRVTRRYEQGADVQNRLPILATYTGHKDIAATQYYVTVTIDILQHAGERFERLCAPRGE